MDPETIEGWDDGLTLADLVQSSRDRNPIVPGVPLLNHACYSQGEWIGTFMLGAFRIQIGSQNRTSGTLARGPQSPPS